MNNRTRILRLIDVLRKYSDEEHPLTLEEIKDKLRLETNDENLKVTNRTITTDLFDLDTYGIDIESIAAPGRPTQYYLMKREFDLHQLRILVDAISASRFITNDQKREIIRKLKSQTSVHQNKSLHNEMFSEYAIESQHNQLHYFIDNIHSAIANKQAIGFQYGRYTIKKEFQLSHGGKDYTVYPLALVWSSEFYYLIARYQPTNEIRHYRIDRMKNLKILEETYSRDSFDIHQYLSRVFNMYVGDLERIKVVFDEGLLNTVIDRFGLQANITEIDDEHFLLDTYVSRSKGLQRWLLTWGRDAQVIYPQSLVDEMREEVRGMYELYEK
ncbi:MAG: helix-turn-helix transcriptional regulator [Bacilli bacterium]